MKIIRFALLISPCCFAVIIELIYYTLFCGFGDLDHAFNLISSFVDDVLVPYPDRYKAMQDRDNIYNDYKKWCNESNSVPMSSRWFWPRLRQKVNVTEVREAFTRKASITLKN